MVETASASVPKPLPASVQQDVYETIREQLLKGRWAPGQMLPEHKLAAEFGVNRNPVREALLQLVGEGFLERQVGVGCRVARVDAQSMTDLWELRESVEGMACRLVARKADASQLARIQYEQDLFERVVSMGADPAVIECDTRFHGLIIEASGNAALLRVWNQFLVRSVSLQNTLFFPKTQASAVHARTIEWHRRLLAALKARDPDAAEDTARASNREALRAMLRMLAEQNVSEDANEPAQNGKIASQR